MIYTIEVRSEHPLLDMTVAHGAKAIAEELGHEGCHGFSVTVSAGEQTIASWVEEEPEG
jgi:hypothetical protein